MWESKIIYKMVQSTSRVYLRTNINKQSLEVLEQIGRRAILRSLDVAFMAAKRNADILARSSFSEAHVPFVRQTGQGNQQS